MLMLQIACWNDKPAPHIEGERILEYVLPGHMLREARQFPYHIHVRYNINSDRQPG